MKPLNQASTTPTSADQGPNQGELPAETGLGAVPAAGIQCDREGGLTLEAQAFSASGGVFEIRRSDATLRASDASAITRDAQGVVVMFPDLRCVMSTDTDGALTLMLTNTSADRPVDVTQIQLRFEPECFASPRLAPEHHQLVHGRDPSCPSGIKPVHLPFSRNNQIAPASELFTIFSSDKTDEALLIGALPPFGDGYTSVRAIHSELHAQGAWGLSVGFELGQRLEPGASLTTSAVLVLAGESGATLLDEYRQQMRRRNPRPTKPAATGWNSWDYYAGAVTRADMDENARACQQMFKDQLRHVVIDEGYECMWGVWDANWKFPEGLKDYCQHVKSLGLTPGIWTAPLMVNVYTPLYREHPDWFISEADGNVHLITISYGTMAQLDITHPGVQAHLREVYGRLVEAGFEYFKCDFVQMVRGAELFHDRGVGRAEIIRRVFQLVRQCIGEDRYLLSCLAPFESVIGIADAHRTTADIHNQWTHISYNVQSMFLRQWMQGSVGNTDPDFLIVRSAQSSDDPMLNRRLPVRPEDRDGYWNRGPAMTLEQARVLALAIHLTGGDVVLGDALERLNKQGVDVLRRVVPPSGEPGRVLNLFQPGQQLTPIVAAPRETGWLIGLFNLSDQPCRQSLDLPWLGDVLRDKPRVTDFWGGGAIEVSPDKGLTLAPRSARGLVIDL